MSAVRLVGQQAEEWLITANLPALAPANTATAATIQRQSGQAFLNTQQCPNAEVWHIEDIFVEGANPIPETAIRMLVNGAPQPFTPRLSSINIQRLSRERLARTIVIGQGAVITAEFINDAVVGAVPHTVQVRAKVMRYPVS